MRIISFSADGIINAAENGFYDWLTEQDADFVCVQDLRCSEYDLQDNKFFPQDYNAYFLDDIDGKANGVAIYCRKLPKAIMSGLGFADFDMEGRYIQADYENLSVGCLLAPFAEPGNAAIACVANCQWGAIRQSLLSSGHFQVCGAFYMVSLHNTKPDIRTCHQYACLSNRFYRTGTSTQCAQVRRIYAQIGQNQPLFL